jgi:hypothetical protein
MISLIILCLVLSGITVWQRLEIVNLKYRVGIIESYVDKMAAQVKREHNGMVSYDLLLRRLTDIKNQIKHGK